MKILHYSLGFPPYRTGGLVKFALDLAEEQSRKGDDVSFLWPGEIKIISKTIRIKKKKNYEKNSATIKNYEIINPIPVSYDEGITEFDNYMAYGDVECYKKFLTAEKFDVVHIHTFMGLHKAFLDAANELGIKLVFTAHDFFPICPKVTMYRNGDLCSTIASCDKCAYCNMSALSMKKVILLQSPLYRFLKNTRVVRAMRKKHRDGFLSENIDFDESEKKGSTDDYINLRNHYKSMLNAIDVVHFNSSVTKNVYEAFLGTFNNVVIPISHSDIRDNRIRKQFDSEVLRIRYLGAYSGAKGFFVLIDALNHLWEKEKNFQLDVHFNPPNSAPYIKIHDRYSYDELERIFLETDVLVVPSVWYETFGFTVIEALSYGVPVILTQNVGAQDILQNGEGIIVKPNDANALEEAIESLNSEKLKDMNDAILSAEAVMTIREMTNRIQTEIYNGNK